MKALTKHIVKTFGGMALAACAAAVPAQDGYPAHPIRVIVPWPAGGGVDVVTRAITEKMSATMGQQFVIDNRPGATGNIGAAMGAKAPADGYTLLVSSAPMAINTTLQKNLSFDLGKDFAPVGPLASSTYVLVANSSVGNTVADLVARAKAEPGKLTYASVGPGTQQNLIGEMFKRQARVEIVHAPYKGGPPALTDIMGGHIQMMFHGVPAVMPFVKSGKIKALAVASAQRLPLFPDVPTMKEAGFPGIDAKEWYGLVVPVGTPKEVVARLNSELNKALEAPDLREGLIAKGYEPASAGTPAQFGAFMAAEQTRWAQFVKETGFRLD